MPKLIFANQLRGLAAIFVAISHLAGVFWIMRDFTGMATATPVIDGAAPPILSLAAQPWLNFGPFGVGVFFLISGLVIPISLGQHTRGSFLLARILRIYPTYIVALLLEMAVLHANAIYWGKPFPYGNRAIVSNALLIYNTVGQPCVDLVNWTLCVELKFYLLAMLLATQIRRGSVLTLLLTGAAILAANVVLMSSLFHTGDFPNDLAAQFTIESTFVVFMLIGVLFNFHLRGLLRLSGFIGAWAGMLALFLASWTQSAIASQFPVVMVNYLYALALFSVFYLLRGYARPVRVLDFAASISFPFYLIHSLIGFSVLKILILRFGFSYVPAVCITVAVLVCVASALHFTIEIKSVAMGKVLARRQNSSVPPPLMPRRVSAM